MEDIYRLRTSIGGKIERVNSRLKELLGLDEAAPLSAQITMRGIAKVTVGLTAKAALILVVMLGTAVGAVSGRTPNVIG